MKTGGRGLLLTVMRGLVSGDIDPRIADTGDLILDGIVLSIRVDEGGGLFTACAEVGPPGAWRKSAAYRQALQAHFAAPAPWTLAAALHPQRDCLMLCGCAPLGSGAVEDCDVSQAAALVQRMVACARAWQVEIASC